MEVNPFISTGAFIKNRDPMVSSGSWKKRYDYLFFKFIKKDGSVCINILLYKLFLILS